MEQIQDDPDLDYMAKIGKQINPKIDPEVFKTMVKLSIKKDGQEKLIELEKEHSIESELLNCLREIR